MMKPTMRNLIICLAVCALTLGLGTARALRFRSNCSTPFDYSDDNIGNIVFGNGYSDSIELLGAKLAASAADLAERSDCVLRVRVNEGIEFLGRNYLASVKVVKTLSGEAPDADEVFIYEPVEIWQELAYLPDDLGISFTSGIANKLQPEREYVVALKQVDLGKGAFNPEHDGGVYMYTDILCSSFPCGAAPVCYNMADYPKKMDDAPTTSEMRGYDYLASRSYLDEVLVLYDDMVAQFGTENFN